MKIANEKKLIQEARLEVDRLMDWLLNTKVYPLDDDDDAILDELDTLNGYDPNEWGFEDELTRRIELEPKSKEKRCECGTEKCGSNKHSEWCPKYKKEDM